MDSRRLDRHHSLHSQRHSTPATLVLSALFVTLLATACTSKNTPPEVFPTAAAIASVVPNPGDGFAIGLDGKTIAWTSHECGCVTPPR